VVEPVGPDVGGVDGPALGLVHGEGVAVLQRGRGTRAVEQVGPRAVVHRDVLLVDGRDGQPGAVEDLPSRSAADRTGDDQLLPERQRQRSTGGGQIGGVRWEPPVVLELLAAEAVEAWTSLLRPARTMAPPGLASLTSCCISASCTRRWSTRGWRPRRDGPRNRRPEGRAGRLGTRRERSSRPRQFAEVGSPRQCRRWRMRCRTRSGATRHWGVGPLQAGYGTEMEAPLSRIVWTSNWAGRWPTRGTPREWRTRSLAALSCRCRQRTQGSSSWAWPWPWPQWWARRATSMPASAGEPLDALCKLGEACVQPRRQDPFYRRK